MNQEQMMKQQVQLTCEDCGRQDKAQRHELVEEGWNWKEGKVAGLFNLFAAECPDCDVDIKDVFDEKQSNAEDGLTRSQKRREQKLDAFA